MTKQMQELCNERSKLLEEGKALVVENKLDELANVNNRIAEVDNKISALEKFEASEKESAEIKPVENKKFKSLSEQLKAIMTAGKTKDRVVDERLKNDLSGGANTGNNADGGYAIQSDFVGAILDRAFEKSEIMNRCTTRSITSNSNRANWVTIDDANDAYETGVVVGGGVQAYWAEEGVTVTKSKPKYTADELKLAKVMGICYTTEEMLEDVSFTAQVIEDSFADAVAGLITNGILNGLGTRSGYATEPVGIMTSNALVEVPAHSTSLTAQDFLNMKARIRKKNWANAVWVLHPDLEADLPLLNDGSDMAHLVFMPEGGISGNQYATILGRPVIFDEFVGAKGTKGDILLADFSEYLLIKKGEERKDWSIHVAFLTDEQVFRIVLRINGKPFRNTVYAVRNSSVTRSPFVTLGARGTKLTMSTVTISTNTASWDAVSNATKYIYAIKEANSSAYGQETANTTRSVSSIPSGATIRVKAVGNGTTYLDSDWKTATNS